MVVLGGQLYWISSNIDDSMIHFVCVILENFTTANQVLICCWGFVAALCRQQSPIAMCALEHSGAKLMDFHQSFIIPPLFPFLAYVQWAKTS